MDQKIRQISHKDIKLTSWELFNQDFTSVHDDSPTYVPGHYDIEFILFGVFICTGTIYTIEKLCKERIIERIIKMFNSKLEE